MELQQSVHPPPADVIECQSRGEFLILATGLRTMLGNGEERGSRTIDCWPLHASDAIRDVHEVSFVYCLPFLSYLSFEFWCRGIFFSQ